MLVSSLTLTMTTIRGGTGCKFTDFETDSSVWEEVVNGPFIGHEYLTNFCVGDSAGADDELEGCPPTLGRRKLILMGLVEVKGFSIYSRRVDGPLRVLLLWYL